MIPVPVDALNELAYFDDVRETFAKHGFVLCKPLDYEAFHERHMKEMEQYLESRLEEATGMIKLMISDDDSSGHC